METILGDTIRVHEERCEIAKAKIPEGPWAKEPHRFEFKHEGLDCLLVRQTPSFHWCGYVGVPETHKLYKKDYNEIENENEISVHGGLTYSAECEGAVCHHAKDEDTVWWIGYDCAHSGDLCPSYLKYKDNSAFSCLLTDHRGNPSVYRDIEWVINETKHLAEQLARMA